MSKDLIFRPEDIGNVDSVSECLLKRFNPGRNRQIHIVKSFIDARHKDNIKVVYRVEAVSNSEAAAISKADEELALPWKGQKVNMKRPVVIGFGPAGMYASLILAEYGLEPLIIERGSKVEKRIKDIDAIRNGLSVNPESNVQFGEGGAGTFSDGKLYTGVTSGLKAYISRIMVENGADPSIMYDSHPHVGTDRLREVVKGIREKILANGGEFLWDTLVKDLVIENGRIRAVQTDKGTIEAENVILAIGHSSRDSFKMLRQRNVAMEAKAFSIGVRIEHRREMIDLSQYGFDTAQYKNISAAAYKAAVDCSTGRKLYTFCMCPGGEVIAAQSSDDAICTNGMSWSRRDLDNSNSALLVPIDRADYGEDILGGMYYQEKIEKKAFIAGGSARKAPYNTYEGLIKGKEISYKDVIPSFKPGVESASFDEIFEAVIIETLKDGINKMGRKIKGFDSPDAVITAPEARSSSPVRILRNKDSLQSINVSGLYPCGEGAGYAGGIMSSAIDGIKCANAIVQNMIN